MRSLRSLRRWSPAPPARGAAEGRTPSVGMKSCGRSSSASLRSGETSWRSTSRPSRRRSECQATVVGGTPRCGGGHGRRQEGQGRRPWWRPGLATANRRLAGMPIRARPKASPPRGRRGLPHGGPEFQVLWAHSVVAVTSSGRLVAQLEDDDAGMITTVRHNNESSAEIARDVAGEMEDTVASRCARYLPVRRRTSSWRGRGWRRWPAP